jgi:hypothetical protein
MTKAKRQKLWTNTSFANCHSPSPGLPDANIEFLCRLNVEDREAEAQDRYVLHKLLKALRPLASMPILSFRCRLKTEDREASNTFDLPRVDLFAPGSPFP